MTDPRDILVVDDSRMVLEMVSDILSAEGYDVRRAENGRIALEAVAAQKPDLILLDIMMPEVDGYEVCQALRQEEEYIPVLMITAKGALEDLVRGIEAGADDYISKPFEPVELVARVKSLLRIRSLQKELYQRNQELEATAAQLDAANKELQLLSVTDGLTRAHNHRHFQERLKSEFARAKRYGESLTCVMADIDHFKAVNDRFGHPFGDKVLVRVVEILKEAIRTEDLVARYGGEEFVLLLPNTSSTQALTLAERIRQHVESESLPLGRGERFAFTISLGIADYRPGCPIQGPDELLQCADRALYEAKANGRNRVVVA